jgi:hypothetical protein
VGYHTVFTGHVTVEPPLNRYEITYLRRFADSRHLRGTTGPYYLEGDDSLPEVAPVALDSNKPPESKPDRYCQWIPTEDGAAIQWDDEREKFCDAQRWMAYLIDHFLKPDAAVQRQLREPVPGWEYPEEFDHFTFDHVVNGEIDAEGDEPEDLWRLSVRDNVVYMTVSDAWDEFAGEIRHRHNIVYEVRDNRCYEVGQNNDITYRRERWGHVVD